MYGFEHTASVKATITTDGTFSTAININGANRVAFFVPTAAVGTATDSCNVYVQVAQTTTTSEFSRIKDMGVYSAASGIHDWEVPSSIGQYTVLCRPVTGFKYMRLEIGSGGASVAATAALSCVVHVMK